MRARTVIAASAGPQGKPRVRQEKEPASAEVVEVAPDVLRLQLPVSVPGIGHVNCYALCDDDGVALVDPGMHSAVSWTALLDRLNQAGIPLKRVRTVVVTHAHFDHYGGCHRLLRETDAELLAHTTFSADQALDLFIDDIDPPSDGPTSTSARSRSDAGVVASDACAGPPDVGAAPGSRSMPWGLSDYPYPMEAIRTWLQAAGGRSREQLRAPVPTVRVDDGAVLKLAGREWFAVHTPGHTIDHLCLWDPTEGVLLSGDHVLPTITPHISGSTAEEFDDPLASFLDSLERVAAFKGLTVCLPGHGHPFPRLRERARAIIRHHDEQLDMLRATRTDSAFVDAPVEAFMEALFPRRGWGYMAASETYVHLEHLRALGEATSCRDSVGMLRYRI